MLDDLDDDYAEGERFKKVIKFVMLHHKMAKEMGQNKRDMLSSAVDEAECQILDPAFYKRQPKPKPGVLTESAKNILRKPSHKRTQPEIMECMEIMKDMSFMEKFPEKILIALSGAFMYTTHNKKQIVMRQGHKGCAMYFIYNGLVDVKVIISERNRSPIEITVAKLGAGSQIGGISLLNDSLRSASIACTVTTHFLVLYKEDFDLIMKDFIAKEYSARLWALNNLASFNTVLWTPNNFEIIMANSMIKYFTKGSLILGGVKESLNWTYFIITGRCRVVKLIEYIEESIRNNTVLHEYKGGEIFPGQTKYRKLIQFCVLQSGHYFSVGEDLETTYILAANNVVCLLAPGILLDRYCRRNFTKILHRELLEEIPTTHRILQLFTRKLVWERYQDRYVRETMKESELHLLSKNCCEKKRPPWRNI